MAELLEDDLGRPKPQYEKPDGSGFEAWKGKDGHGNVRSDDGQIVALGATGDADTANTVIGRLKKILAILPTALSAAGNFKVAINEALPAGSNDIGKVTVSSSALPSGASSAAKQDAMIGYIDGLEADLAAIKSTAGIKKITDPVKLACEELTILSSAARTTSGTSDSFTVGNYKEASFYLNVTAASGTLDVTIETKDPVSSEWFELVKFTQATAVTKERKADKTMDIGSVIRASYTIAGETPSFTFSLGAVVK